MLNAATYKETLNHDENEIVDDMRDQVPANFMLPALDENMAMSNKTRMQFAEGLQELILFDEQLKRAEENDGNSEEGLKMNSEQLNQLNYNPVLVDTIQSAPIPPITHENDRNPQTDDSTLNHNTQDSS